MRAHSIAIAVSTATAAACGPTYLPVATVYQVAPACGSHPIAPRAGDNGPTYFRCQVTRVAEAPHDRVVDYPELLAEAAVEGEVQLQFVIDERGHVDSTSIKVLSSTHELFAAAALASVRGWGVEAAERRGESVRQLTTHAFCFRIGPAGALSRCAREMSAYPAASLTVACADPAPMVCSSHGGCSQPVPRRPPNRRCS